MIYDVLYPITSGFYQLYVRSRLIGQQHVHDHIDNSWQFMAVGTGGQGGGGGAGPSTFQRWKKFNGENALEWCKLGVKFDFFWKFFASLRSPF